VDSLGATLCAVALQMSGTKFQLSTQTLVGQYLVVVRFAPDCTLARFRGEGFAVCSKFRFRC
jgi:hypothetical protein